jgi:hypothetical protein
MFLSLQKTAVMAMTVLILTCKRSEFALRFINLPLNIKIIESK